MTQNDPSRYANASTALDTLKEVLNKQYFSALHQAAENPESTHQPAAKEAVGKIFTLGLMLELFSQLFKKPDNIPAFVDKLVPDPALSADAKFGNVLVGQLREIEAVINGIGPELGIGQPSRIQALQATEALYRALQVTFGKNLFPQKGWSLGAASNN